MLNMTSWENIVMKQKRWFNSYRFLDEEDFSMFFNTVIKSSDKNIEVVIFRY